jgi:hypothetical protein
MIQGLAFHCHHNKLVEFVYDLGERQQVIRDDKPEEEIELRLRLLQIIPEERLPQKGLDEYMRAWEVCKKTLQAYYKAANAFYRYWIKEEYYKYKAERDYYKAIKAYNKLERAYYQKNKVALEKLHKELCPDCPWNGKTIFTRKDAKGNWY